MTLISFLLVQYVKRTSGSGITAAVISFVFLDRFPIKPSQSQMDMVLIFQFSDKFFWLWKINWMVIETYWKIWYVPRDNCGFFHFTLTFGKMLNSFSFGCLLQIYRCTKEPNSGNNRHFLYSVEFLNSFERLFLHTNGMIFHTLCSPNDIKLWRKVTLFHSTPSWITS